MSIRQSLATVVGFVAVLAACPFSSAASQADIDRTILDAKNYLYNQRGSVIPGTWEVALQPAKMRGVPVGGGDVDGGQWGGNTAICTYALLAAGEHPWDPRLAPAIDFLKKADLAGIYAIGLRAQVWTLLSPSPEIRALAKRDAQLLIGAMGKKTPDTGFYSYTTFDSIYHHSPSQYAVLGLWACDQVGAEVPQQYWKMVDAGWRRTQQPNGGWSYYYKPTLEHTVCTSMTAAGVATLFITEDSLRAGEGITCRPDPPNAAIDRGLQWMADHFGEVGDPYTWYGVERIGTASGLKYFKGTDWYQTGADLFVRTQTNANGSWQGIGGPLPATCFGLVFLARGGAPVVMNKLAYRSAVVPTTRPGATVASEGDSSWNVRPRDAANIVRWMGYEMEHTLNWQIVDLLAPPEELLEAPILYLAGSKAPAFSADERAKLRQYVDLGGLMLGNADCADETFAAAFQQLGTDLFPGYTWRELPAEHPIYANQQFVRSKWKSKPSVLGLSNGTRELMLLIPQADAGRAWQITDKSKLELLQLMADVFQYASGKNIPRKKRQTYLVEAAADVKDDRTLRVARLKYNGNWDPEPAGWGRLKNIVHNTDRMGLEVTPVELGVAPLTADAAGYALAHLTAAGGSLELSDPQRRALQDYVAGGGVLLIDAAGGDSATAESIEVELRKIFPAQAGQLESALMVDDSLFTPPAAAGSRGAFEFNYTSFAHRWLGPITTPRLRGLRFNGRLGVLYSPDDLSTALVGVPTDGVSGYTPETAARIVRKLLLLVSKTTPALPPRF